MTRNLAHTNGVVRSIQDDTTASRRHNEMFIELFQKQQEDNKKMISYLEEKIPDMSDYFPLKNDAALERFMDKSDGFYHLRRAEFYNMLVSHRSNKDNLFATTLMRRCFSKKFIRFHTWPGPR